MIAGRLAITHSNGGTFTTFFTAAVLCLRAQLCIWWPSRDRSWRCRLDAGQGKKEAGQKHLLRRAGEAAEGCEDIREEGYATASRLKECDSVQWLTTPCAGSIVPISMGRMRNEWFPRRIAEYVPQTEVRTLRMSNTAMERDVEFGVSDLAAQISKSNADKQRQDEYAFTVRKAPEVEKVAPERSIQLLDIFVPKALDFYRQPLPEETKEAESEPADAFGSGAAGELFAARQKREEKLKAGQPKGIYGSVSTQDIVAAVRAAMENNDESARVIINETDLKFVNAGSEVEELARVKHVGSYTIEIMIKGAEAGLRRTVKVHAQEA